VSRGDSVIAVMSLATGMDHCTDRGVLGFEQLSQRYGPLWAWLDALGDYVRKAVKQSAELLQLLR